MLRLHNSLSGRVEDFAPLEPGKVRMYNCGPTVYRRNHVGNYRAYMLADLLRRTFTFLGYRVHQVMNITDVGHLTEDDAADARGEDNSWNSSFNANTAPSSNGWQAELAIPLGDLAIAGKRLRVNLARFDETANSYSELTPTFGHSPLDHRVPMYQSDPLAAGAFANLKLE